MIITRTPFRISFGGGGSDLPSFYQKHEGCVVSSTINKYMYITVHPSFNREITTIKYRQTENVDDIRKICHPIARQLLLDHKLSGVEIDSISDIPSGTGLSSSSAYTVGLIHALYAFEGKYCSQERIAKEACELEIEKLGEPIGKQDQYGTSIGGLKFIRFLRNGRVDVEPIIIDNDVYKELESNLLLFYTGITHEAGGVLKEQQKNIEGDSEKFEFMIKMTEIAWQMKENLTDGNLEKFGQLLHENWNLKRKLAGLITNAEIDAYYDKAINAGAIGGKLLGAGGGGFLLFYCPKDRKKHLRAVMSDLVELPFKFEQSGTKVLYVGEKDWD